MCLRGAWSKGREKCDRRHCFTAGINTSLSLFLFLSLSRARAWRSCSQQISIIDWLAIIHTYTHTHTHTHTQMCTHRCTCEVRARAHARTHTHTHTHTAQTATRRQSGDPRGSRIPFPYHNRFMLSLVSGCLRDHILKHLPTDHVLFSLVFEWAVGLKSWMDLSTETITVHKR